MENNQRVALFVIGFFFLGAFNIMVWQPIREIYGKPKEYTYGFNITFTITSILVLIFILVS